ncbi:hypothetical protein [Streptomyces sp. AC550_RSS872]|uniref:hypothetical protein n=1 Tax=Streptomyces sp. AC550_RSS872 TaxID=2823689 RepID=UPI001C277202|nr:hypothetical protein [Streptomyces sp. AC550_RSS872]
MHLRRAPAERGHRPRNLHITERDRILDHVRDLQDDLAKRRAALPACPSSATSAARVHLLV